MVSNIRPRVLTFAHSRISVGIYQQSYFDGQLAPSNLTCFIQPLAPVLYRSCVTKFFNAKGFCLKRSPRGSITSLKAHAA